MAEQFKPYNVLLGNKIDFPPFHRKYKKKIKKENKIIKGIVPSLKLIFQKLYFNDP